MRTETRQYEAGAVIFREGEDSDAAFMIESGRVELLKGGRGGVQVQVGELANGDLFGETGVLDNGPRNVMARALTDVIVRVIPRSEFLRAIQDDPATALKVMTRLARRQRDADERLAAGGAETTAPLTAKTGTAKPATPGTALVTAPLKDPPPIPPRPMITPGPAMARRAGLLGRLMDAIAPGAATKLVKKRPPVVAVTPLSLEAQYDQRPFLITQLNALDGIEVRPTTAPLFTANDPVPDFNSTGLHAKARALQAEEKADVLIWGGEDAEGRTITLFFSNGQPPMYDRLGGLPPDQPLVVPADFDESWAPLLRACVAVALGDETGLVATLAAEAQDRVSTPHPTLSMEEGAMTMAVYGYLAVTIAGHSRRGDWLERAVTAWRDALSCLPNANDRRASRLSMALGMVLQGQGEKHADEQVLLEAVKTYRDGLKGVNRDTDPRLWGQLQYRLGGSLFRLDLLTGDEEALRESLVRFREATAVVSRADDPWRWSELTHAIAQAMQVWGDHHKSLDILAKATDLCRAALEVRTAETAPHLYAATRNNMGSALFLMAKHSNDPEYMRLAAVAFRDALAVHRATGAGGALYKTIERNLSRAEELLRREDARPVAQPSWAAESPYRVSMQEEDDPGMIRL